MTESMPQRLTHDSLSAALLDDNTEARKRFRDEHAEPLSEVRDTCLRSYRAIDVLNNGHPEGDLRFDTARLFMHTAFNNVLTSTNLLVAGLPLPSGHMMRHAGESLAMALLIADAQSGVLERFHREGPKYPVQDAISTIRRPKRWKRVAELLDLSEDGAAMLRDLEVFYSGCSHSGAFALGYQFVFAADGALVVGAEFDPAKRDHARTELAMRLEVFEVIKGLADRLGEILAPRGMATDSSPSDLGTPT